MSGLCSILAQDGALVPRDVLAASPEARSPSLDRELLALAARVPSNLKLRGGVTKAILKQLVARLLPPEIINRREHGFGVPAGRQVREDLRDCAHGYFREFAMRVLNNKHESGQRNHEARLWVLLIFGWRQRLFINPPELRTP